MGMIADLFVKLGLKSDDFNKGLDKAKKETSSFGSAIGKIGGMIAGAFAVGTLINFGKSAAIEFDKAEKGATRLLTALRGNQSALEEITAQAKELQKTTLFEDDETVAAAASMAMLMKEADQIKLLLPLVQDLATAKGMDLTSAGFMVAKAVEGSGAALQKMGIQVEGTAGSAQRFKSVMDGLNKAVGGQSVAAANVGTGAATKLANAFGNLKEAIGGGVVESGAFKTSMSALTTYLDDVTAIMESEHKPKWRKFWEIVTGRTANAADIEAGKKEAEARLKAVFAPKTIETKPKEQTASEQLAERVKFLKQQIVDTSKEMSRLSASTPEWKEAADELKKLKDELSELTGSTKKQEEADKAATKAKEDLVDMLILQKLEQQKISDLQGKDLEGGMKLRGDGTLESPAATPVKGLDTTTAIKKQKEAEILALKEGNKEAEEEEKRHFDDLDAIIFNGFADAFTTLTNGLANLAAGNITGAEFGKSILTMVGAFMIQLGTLMITTSELFTAWKASLATGGWGSIGFGIALVAAGAAVSAFAKKGPGSGSKAASGYGGSQSQSNAGSVLNGNVVFELRGNTLKGVLNNQDRRNYNMG